MKTQLTVPRWMVAGGAALLMLWAPVAMAQIESAHKVPNGNALGALFWTQTANCAAEKDDMLRRQCAAVRQSRVSAHVGKTFVVRADQSAIQIGELAADGLSVPVALHGCLACKAAVPVGDGKGHVITVGETSIKGGSLLGPVLYSGVRKFKSRRAGQIWMERVGPRLRADIAFKVPNAAARFARGASNGYAVPLVAYRVYDPCDGKIVAARPVLKSGPKTPGTCGKPMPADEDPDKKGKKTAPVVVAPKLPRRLSASQVNATMRKVRREAYRCFEDYGVPGDAKVKFRITKAGKVRKVKLRGEFARTPTGTCVVKAVFAAQFPEFSGSEMKISYPFQLR